MMTENLKAEDLKVRLAEANNTIEMARRELSEGKIVSLGDLEDHVDVTCRGIAELSKDEGVALQPTMLALIDGLEQLSSSLGEDHRQSETALNGLSDRERAQSAYSQNKKS